jgi:hypothetical protein
MKVAKARGRLLGKQPKLTPRQEAHLVSMYRTGEHTSAELGELFNVARSTVYRALEHIPGFNIDRVAAAAGDDPDVLRMGNLDTDIPPSEEAMEATRAASLFTVSPTRGRVTRWRRQQLAAAARIARSRTSSARSV